MRFIRRASRERRLPKLGGGRPVVGMNKGAPPIAVQRSGLHAAVFVNALVEPIELTVGPRCPDVVGHRLRERTKLRFAGSQDFLRHASFVHVAKNGGDEHARLAFPARERHFKITRRAILASRHHFDWLAHGVTIKDRASRRVPRRAILEKQRGRLADQFFRHIAELPIRGRIGELNDVLVVEGQDDVRRAVDNGVVARILPLAQETFAFDRDGHVENLDETVAVRRVVNRAHRRVDESCPDPSAFSAATASGAGIGSEDATCPIPAKRSRREKRD